MSQDCISPGRGGHVDAEADQSSAEHSFRRRRITARDSQFLARDASNTIMAQYGPSMTMTWMAASVTTMPSTGPCRGRNCGKNENANTAAFGLRTLETTDSGFLGGLPLRLLVGYRPELIADRLGLRPVPENRVTLAGARDLDPPEVASLARAAIKRTDVAGLDDAALPGGPLCVHLDLDVVDPSELPGLRYPASGGPGAADITRALRALLATGRVAVVGIACTWHAGYGTAARIGPFLENALATKG